MFLLVIHTKSNVDINNKIFKKNHYFKQIVLELIAKKIGWDGVTLNFYVGWVEGINLRLFYCLGSVVRGPLQG